MHRIAAGVEVIEGNAGGEPYQELQVWTTCTCSWQEYESHDVTGFDTKAIAAIQKEAVQRIHIAGKEHITRETDPFDGLTLENDSDDPRDWR